MAREQQDRKHQSRAEETHERNSAPEADQLEPGERSSETAKDINVVRGDDRPQTVRHSG